MDTREQFDWDDSWKVWDVIHEWVKLNARKIIRIHNRGYGWEPWLQADLADFIQERTRTTISRESLLYGHLQGTGLTTWTVSDGSLTNYFVFKCGSEKMGLTGLDSRLSDAHANAMTIVGHRRDKRAYIMGFSLKDFAEKSDEFAPCTSCTIDGVDVIWKVARTLH